MRFIRTNAGNKDFQMLVRDLDLDLSNRDGSDHKFYDQFNKIDNIQFAVVAYDETSPIGCGAIKAFSEDAMEVKRMFVSPPHRGKGIAQSVLLELEKWAREMNFSKCILETGKRQPEAIALYMKAGYKTIPNYGQYENVENSICFEKVLN
ncbi:MAG: GNAT family N-acetyltransferase [Chitinophagales bacterium]